MLDHGFPSPDAVFRAANERSPAARKARAPIIVVSNGELVQADRSEELTDGRRSC
jgi:hypothetical protein